MNIESIWRAWSDPLLTLGLGLSFILLNILDGHSTWSVLNPDHYYRERNPIARWIFRKLGLVPGIIVFKTVLMVFLAGCVGYYAAYDAGTINVVLLVADLLFIWVVRHNYRVAGRIGRHKSRIVTKVENDWTD